MDKYFLLTYTYAGQDGFYHGAHAWFETEEEMRKFVKQQEHRKIEVDLAIEILSYREILL